jgi:hypothetical protein
MIEWIKRKLAERKRKKEKEKRIKRWIEEDPYIYN